MSEERRGERFAAFLSYSHRSDRDLAEALHHRVQVLGARLREARRLRVFRDDATIPATADLWKVIAQALDDSRYFVLLASRDAANSDWVKRELDHWLSREFDGGTPEDRMVFVLTHGEVHWSRELRTFDWEHTDAIPRVLDHSLLDEGRPPRDLSAQAWPEPLLIDLRWYREAGRRRRRSEELEDAAARIAARLEGVGKDVVLARELTLQRRRLALLYGGIALLAALAVLLGAATLGFIEQRDQARSAQARVEANLANGLAISARRATDEKRHHAARELVRAARALSDTALSQAEGLRLESSLLRFEGAAAIEGPTAFLACLRDGSWVLRSTGSSVQLWHHEVLRLSLDSVYLHPSTGTAAAFHPTLAQLVVGSTDGRLWWIDLDEDLSAAPEPLEGLGYVRNLWWSGDAEVEVVADGDVLRIGREGVRHRDAGASYPMLEQRVVLRPEGTEALEVDAKTSGRIDLRRGGTSFTIRADDYVARDAQGIQHVTPVLSKDGCFLLVEPLAGQGIPPLFLFDVTGEPRRIEIEGDLPSSSGDRPHCSFLPGRDAVVVPGENEIALIELVRDSNGPVPQKRFRLGEAIAAWAVNPSFPAVAVGQADGRIGLYDASKPEDALLELVDAHGGEVDELTWSPDGLTLMSSGAGQLRRWSVAPIRTIGVIRARSEEAETGLGLLGLAHIARDAPVAIVQPVLMRAPVVASLDPTAPFAWIPDDENLAAEDRPPIVAGALTDDGRRLLYARRDGEVAIWDLESGERTSGWRALGADIDLAREVRREARFLVATEDEVVLLDATTGSECSRHPRLPGTVALLAAGLPPSLAQSWSELAESAREVWALGGDELLIVAGERAYLMRGGEEVARHELFSARFLEVVDVDVVRRRLLRIAITHRPTLVHLDLVDLESGDVYRIWNPEEATYVDPDRPTGLLAARFHADQVVTLSVYGVLQWWGTPLTAEHESGLEVYGTDVRPSSLDTDAAR